MQPDAVLLTNLLIGGLLPGLRSRLPNARLVVLLQGDDIFLGPSAATVSSTGNRSLSRFGG